MGLDRRQFLARLGVLGAAATVAKMAPAFGQPPHADPLEDIEVILRTLARDAMSGLVAFCVPGSDAYSLAQHVTAPTPGGVAAGGAEFMLHALDNFFPAHDMVMTPIVQALGTGLSDGARTYGLPLPQELLDIPVSIVRQIDDALLAVTENDVTMPLSNVVSLALNAVATWVNPASVAGTFLGSPFANLSWDEKAEAFRRIEQDTANVVALIDANLTEPAKNSVSGLVAFLGGALLDFASFGSYSEFAVLGFPGRQLTATPVGWQMSGYLASTGYQPVEGWNDFRGYYAGRTEAEG